MDNISHTLFGLAAGELVQRSLPPEPTSAAQRTRRRMLLTAGAVASNFPDLDLVLTGLMPEPLGYLLQHRGHTHTLPFALLQALILVLAIWALWPNARRLLLASAAARWGLALCAVGGLVLHLGFDFLNSYGVHPLYPFDGRWLYGDMIFIVEPVFWVAFAVPLALSVQRRARRWSLLALLAGVLLFFTVKGFLLWGSLLGLALLGAGLGALGRRSVAAGMAVALVFIGVQGAASKVGKQAIGTELARRDSASTVLDTALTAYPGNPLCWSFVSVERNGELDSYRLRRGVVSVAPGVLRADACPAALSDVPVEGAAVALTWEQQSPLASLRAAASNDCQMAAWMRFARTPALVDGGALDARFGVKLDGNFSALRQAGATRPACPTNVPPWGTPRADLLAAPASTSTVVGAP